MTESVLRMRLQKHLTDANRGENCISELCWLLLHFNAFQSHFCESVQHKYDGQSGELDIAEQLPVNTNNIHGRVFSIWMSLLIENIVILNNWEYMIEEYLCIFLLIYINFMMSQWKWSVLGGFPECLAPLVHMATRDWNTVVKGFGDKQKTFECASFFFKQNDQELCVYYWWQQRCIVPLDLIFINFFAVSGNNTRWSWHLAWLLADVW